MIELFYRMMTMTMFRDSSKKKTKRKLI